MEFNYFPWAGPHTLAAVCASFFNDGNLRFLKLDRVLGTNSDTAAAIVALARTNVDH